MTVIATGGLGVLFMQETDAIDHHEPDLTLDGLVLLYEGGRGGARMHLVIDCGNSNTVFALYEGEQQRGKWRVATDPRRSAESLAEWLGQAMAAAGLSFSGIEAAIVGSVVPAMAEPLRQLCRHCGVEPVEAERLLLRSGLALRVERPELLGVDRALNALAARRRFALPAVVVDFGTATKFDVVAADGGYEGGAICPGFELGLAALHSSLARVPSVALRRPDRVIGRTTEAALSAGLSGATSLSSRA